MGKVEAWQCIHCKTLFEQKKSMETHRRKCAKETKERLKKETKRQKAIKKANSFRLEVEDIKDIPEIIEGIVKDLGRTMTITKWGLRFTDNLAPTHDAPIGKPTEWHNPRTKYLGWEGQVEGKTDLYHKPIKHDTASFGRIDGFSDLVRAYFYGVNTGSGGGGDKFYFGVRLYLDDFPKLKEKYDLWKVEADKKKIYDNKADALTKKAITELVYKNKRFTDLDDTEKILRARINQINEQRARVQEEIMLGDEYEKATTPPDELKYDSDLYYRYDSLFHSRRY